jgi:hypothetical protein
LSGRRLTGRRLTGRRLTGRRLTAGVERQKTPRSHNRRCERGVPVLF